MFKILVPQPPVIRNDSAGDGHFGAPRTHGTHKGTDYCAVPGGVLTSPVAGTISNYGYCYEGDWDYRYVEVKDGAGYRHRLFYTDLMKSLYVGAEVRYNMPIAIVQDIRKKYPDSVGMLPHVHYEIIGPDGEYINPEQPR